MAGAEARPACYRLLYLHQPTDEQGLRWRLPGTSLPSVARRAKRGDK